MDQNAPNRVIGTGSLEIKPDAQSVHDELQKISERLDSLKEKAARVFDGIPEKLREAYDSVQDIADKASEIQGPQQPQAHTQEQAEPQRGTSIPAPDSPEAKELLEQALRERKIDEALDLLRSIDEKLGILNLRGDS